MAIADDDLAAVRDLIGDAEPPTDVELGAMWDRLGTVEGVARSVIRGRLNDLLARPAELDIDGDARENWTENLRHLTALEADLTARVDAATSAVGVVEVVPLRRAGWGR